MMSRRGVLLMALVVLAAACGDDGDPGGVVGSLEVDRLYEGSFAVLQSPEHGPQLCDSVDDSMPPQCTGLPVVGWDWDAVEGEETRGGTTWGAWHVTGTYDGERFHLAGPPRPARPEDGGRRTHDFSPACEEPEVVDSSEGAAEWEALSTGENDVFDDADLVDAWVSHPAGDRDGPFVANVVVRPGTGQAATDRIREHYAGPLCVVERDAPTAAEVRAVYEQVVGDDARAALGLVSSHTDERRGVVVAEVWVVTDAVEEYAAERWGDLVEVRGLLRPAE